MYVRECAYALDVEDADKHIIFTSWEDSMNACIGMHIHTYISAYLYRSCFNVRTHSTTFTLFKDIATSPLLIPCLFKYMAKLPRLTAAPQALYKDGLEQSHYPYDMISPHNSCSIIMRRQFFSS